MTGTATRECDAKWLKAVSEACRVRLLSREILKRIKRLKEDWESCHYDSEGSYTGNFGPESSDDDADSF